MNVKFIDRQNDLNFACRFLSEEKESESIVYETRPASGFSTFLEYICNNQHNGNIGIIASKRESDIYLSLIKSIQQSEQGRIQLRKAAATAGILDGFEVLCRMIPYIGPGITAGRQKLEMAGLENRNLPREIVLAYLKSYSSSKKNLVLAIDDIQSATEDLKELIYMIKEYDLEGIKFLLGHVLRRESSETASEFSDKIYNIGLEIVDREFINPDREFVEKYIAEVAPSLDVSPSEILEKSNGDIYRIKRLVASKGLETEIDLTDLERFTLGLLDSASQPLRVSDLITILMDTDYVYVDCEREVSDAIDRLLRINYINKDAVSHGDTFVSLRATSEASRVTLQADKLVIADVAYAYFQKFYKNSIRHSRAELSGLLYRLSQLVSRDSVGYWSRELINSSLGAGTLDIARSQISNSLDFGSPKSKADLMTDVTFNFLTKQYNNALELLNNKDYSEWSSDSYLAVLKAVCLNRCRNHIESEKLIKQMLKSEVSDNDACILHSFFINNLVHENRIDEAKKVFQKYIDEFQDVRSYPAFLRTASAIYEPETAIDYLDKAKTISFKLGDVFGAAAISANIGVALMEIGQHKSALEILDKAYDDLLVFGPHHLHIVQNNLGICNIVLENFQKAEALFKKSSRVKSLMPRVYSKINTSMSKSIAGNSEEGLSLMVGLEKEVNECLVDRVRQRYFTNLALLSWYCSEDKKELDRKIKMAWEHKDRKYPESTINTLSLLSQKEPTAISSEKKHAMLLEHWQPCYLEYWYFNPLSSLTDTYIDG